MVLTKFKIKPSNISFNVVKTKIEIFKQNSKNNKTMNSTTETININIKNNSFISTLTRGKELKVYGTIEEPHFIGKDIAEILGYKNPRKVVFTHVDFNDKITVRKARIISSQNMFLTNQIYFLHDTTILINISGLYSLSLKSTLPTSKAFRHWVTLQVIPSIKREEQYFNYELKLQDEKAKLIQTVYNLTKEIQEQRELKNELLLLIVKKSEQLDSL
jgi:anti-repressor protein